MTTEQLPEAVAPLAEPAIPPGTHCPDAFPAQADPPKDGEAAAKPDPIIEVATGVRSPLSQLLAFIDRTCDDCHGRGVVKSNTGAALCQCSRRGFLKALRESEREAKAKLFAAAKAKDDAGIRKKLERLTAQVDKQEAELALRHSDGLKREIDKTRRRIDRWRAYLGDSAVTTGEA